MGACKVCRSARSKSYRTDELKLRDKERHLQKKYGMSLADYEEMYVKQKGTCPLCLRFRDKLFVDHDHQTDEVRELLCNECNFAIGLTYENVETMKRMIDYVERHGDGKERAA